MTSQIRFPTVQPVSKMRRNAPCWCGSGRKWKICHRDRESRARIASPNLPIAKLAKGFRRGSTCYHPDAPAECRGKVIGSHTVQRNGPLRRIARDGHVYGYRVNGIAGEEELPKLIGLRDASVFPGFCSLHDTQLFASVETGQSETTPRTAFLLTYRALAYELHQKKKSRAAVELVASLDHGRSLVDQAFVQQLAAQLGHGSEIAQRELESQLTALKSDYEVADFSRFQAIFITFDQVLPFAASFFVAPYEDLSGQKIQGWYDAEASYVSFASLIVGEASVIMLAWERSSSFGCLGDQLVGANSGDVATLLLRFAVSNSENVFLSPDWYESLGGTKKRELASLFEHNLPGSEPHRLPSGTGALIEASAAQVTRLG